MDEEEEQGESGGVVLEGQGRGRGKWLKKMNRMIGGGESLGGKGRGRGKWLKKRNMGVAWWRGDSCRERGVWIKRA